MPGKKRIAFVCHPYHRGGVTRWMADAAIAAAADGHEVYFVTIEPSKTFFSANGRETMLELLRRQPNDVTIVSSRAGHEFEFGTPAFRTSKYRQLIAQLPQGAALILSDDAAIWEAATSLHDAYFVIGVLHADEDLYYQLAAKYYRGTDALVCVSSRVSQTVLKRVPAINGDMLHTIPCGINLPPFSEHSGEGGKLRLVYAGRVSHYQKRAGDLFLICEQLAGQRSDFHLDIIGDGDARQSLADQVAAAGLTGYVTFHGWQPQQEVNRLMSGADLLLLTSGFEGTPVAMMEALANGCGMVGTRVSGIEDYEYHPLAADCVGIFPVGGIGEAVRKINTLGAVPAGIRRQAARKIAETEFAMSVCLGRYYDILDKERNYKAPVSTGLPAGESIKSAALAFARTLKMTLAKNK